MLRAWCRSDCISSRVIYFDFLHVFVASATDPQHYFWIGGTDSVLEGEWFWAKTGDSVTVCIVNLNLN